MPRPNNERAHPGDRRPDRRRNRWIAWVVVSFALLGVFSLLGASSFAARGARTPASQQTSLTLSASSADASPTPAGTPTPAVACPVAGCPQQLLPLTGNWVLDNIYYGAVPANSSGKPVLVFVHGLTGIAMDWWSNASSHDVNDMYLLAYNAGYPTAFVTLQQSGGRDNDQTMWVNGQTLAQQINQIKTYYNVPKVDVITHSKGGIDTQTAIAYDQSAPYVDQVIMLSAPNTGSPLANNQCSSPPPNPITAICTMTPAYMADFRKNADPLLAAAKARYNIRFWVAGGTNHGPPGSGLASAGQQLALLDPFSGNDGFVAVDSATALQVARYLFVRPLNHDSIRVGHNAFPFIQVVLQAGTPLAGRASRSPGAGPLGFASLDRDVSGASAAPGEPAVKSTTHA